MLDRKREGRNGERKSLSGAERNTIDPSGGQGQEAKVSKGGEDTFCLVKTGGG